MLSLVSGQSLSQKNYRNSRVIRANHPKMLLLGLSSCCIRMLEPCETYWCRILILKNNSSTLRLGSLLSTLTLLQNHFFSVLLWERKKIWQFPLLLPWHILCARELAQRSWYCPLLGRRCVCTPREELLGLASLVESPRHCPAPAAAQGASAAALDAARPFCQWLLYFISLCSCFPGSM